MDENSAHVLSTRGRTLYEYNDFLNTYMNTCYDNQYSIKNPTGYVNVGTAENYLCDDLLAAQITKLNIEWCPSMGHYFKYEGIHREPIARFFNRYFAKSNDVVSAEDITVVNGTCSGFDCIAHCIGSPGDVFLCPAPFYTRINDDMNERALVGTYPIPLTSTVEPGDRHQFQLTLERVKNAFLKARKEGKNVRGIVLLNPSNPLGSYYPKGDLMPIFEFAASEELFVVVDEIYALSTFNDTAAPFESVLSYWRELPDPARTCFMWGLSKDFTLAGLRVSMVVTRNEALQKCLRTLSMYHTVAPNVQALTEKLLADYDWIDHVFLPTNRKRMRESYEFAVGRLEACGAQVFRASAAFFVFADFRRFLAAPTFEAEFALFQRFFANGVYIVPARELYCAEPGWFRIVFSVPRELLEVGLSRIEGVLTELDREKN